MGAAGIKWWRVALAAGTIAALAGCGMFFAPLNGRWNLADPKVELVSVVRSLEPTADGWVDDSGTRDFNGTVLSVRYPGTPQQRSLLRFDLSRAPVDLTRATLRVYCSAFTPAPAVTVDVGRIMDSWEPSSVGFGLAYGSVYGSIGVHAARQYYECDVTSYVLDMLAYEEPYGLVLLASGGEVVFDSSRGGHPPVLELAGQDIPDY